jgi:hypothetical protein
MKFKRQVSAEGRNGLIKQSGVDILVTIYRGTTVTLTPITSKGSLARCTIEIPAEDWEQFASEVSNAIAERSSITECDK